MPGIHIAEAGWLHTTATRVYRTYHNVDQAFKKMLINAFEDQYLNVISDEITVYENCTSLQFLTHRLTYYTIIAPTELTQNYERLNTPYDPNQPIENLLTHSGCLGICCGRWTTLWRCDDHKCCV
jgi:hypothetical protein